MTHLRKRMLEELQRRNYSEGTTRSYLQAVQQFAVHFGKSPDKLGPDDLRSDQAYLLVERKLAVASVVARVAALRFFFVRTLKRREFREELPYPKSYRRLPMVLSLEEVASLIGNKQRIMALTATEFLRRFCQHVLPRGFVRIRHFGYLASAHRTARLALARLQLACQPQPNPGVTNSQLATWRCPRCGANMHIGPNLTSQQLAFRCKLSDTS